MPQTQKQPEESTNFLILILFALLGKVLFDFKMMGGFNYPLLIKIIYIIAIVFVLMILFHSGDVKNAIKQTKIEDYLNKITK